ncbi:hypothetical protein C7S18_04895 [Ahniella affigens]|uniref:Protein kinase domain-containing protein n=1 Tax=Ahniella affigens TaxID=2021234 RepID=A0A2P1PP06_9GAMM|nr:serine/threonine-protein kinase [Ahniella affigens]AVP96579.1 hypothetical protein C7S18_04895 [Ahniella affigens]
MAVCELCFGKECACRVPSLPSLLCWNMGLGPALPRWSRVCAGRTPVSRQKDGAMSSDHFSKVRELFALALEQPAASREAFVREHASDPAIATEVLRLMGLDEQPQIHTLQGVQAMADAEAAPLAQGRRVGKFELFEVLGEGGMGQVYRARRVDGPEHWVAVKLMRRGLFNAASETRFLAEQQFLARLNHPNIAHYIDSGSDADGHVYVAMELVQGQRLLDFAKAKELNAKQRVTLFRQLLAAVSYAHRQLIIHRDLKQANVLVTADGVVKLLDFGIAKLLQDQSQMTGTIERLYTPTCAAPEQIRGEPCDVTTDVYALGVLLYELIAGKSIFDTEGKTPGEFENLVLNVPPPDMKSRVHADLGCADIPTDLERIVAKAIRKEPNRRYNSVEQFDADLERLLNNEPVSVSGNGFLYRTQKFLSRNKLASGLTTLIAIAVLTGLGITLQQNREIRAERDRANLALDAMKQAFLGADPGGEAGGEVKAKDILNKSSENLLPLIRRGDTQFIELAATLLEVELSMGMVNDAAKTFSEIPEDTIRSHPTLCLLQARLYADRGLPDQAKAQISSCTSGPNESRLRSITQARIAEANKEFLKAAELYREFRKGLDTSDHAWIYALERESFSLSRAGRPEQSIQLIDKATEMSTKAFSPDHARFARLDLARIKVLQAGTGHEEFLQLAPKILERIEQQHGARSTFTAEANSWLAFGYSSVADYASALPHYEIASNIYADVYGSGHRETIRAKFNVAMAMSKLKRPPTKLVPMFESLIIESDFSGNYDLQTFIQISYIQYLTNIDMDELALRVAIKTAESPENLFRVDSVEYERFQRSANRAFWKSRCTSESSVEESRARICRSLILENQVCHAAKRAICGTRDLFR